MWTLTGNDVFDFYFGFASLFAFTGWTIGILKSLLKRLLR